MIYIAELDNRILTLIPSSPSLRELAAALSVRTEQPLISDCTEVWPEDGKVFVRKPSLDGKSFSKYELDANTSYVLLLKTSDAADKLLAACQGDLAGSLAGASAGSHAGASDSSLAGITSFPDDMAHEKLLYPLEQPRDEAAVTNVERSASSGTHVRDAELIFAGGRGIMNEESFAALRKLAGLYGASVGASRPMVDQGWATWDEQIGQTGSIVKPKVYVAFGISGAVQHITGIEKSQNIIAVNLKQDSPIFRYANFGAFADDNSIIRNMLNLVDATC